jgi:hypothetical protein
VGVVVSRYADGISAASRVAISRHAAASRAAYTAAAVTS